MTRARHCSKLTKASHAQRTPLNMGALHCVTDNHMHIYTARTSGEVKDMRRPLRFRTSTRGFATTVELQQAMSRGPVLARRLRRRQGGNRRELRGRGSATVERWWLRVEEPHAPAACASWQHHYATRRCSSTMSYKSAHERIPCTCARKIFAAGSDRLEACHQKFTPQLRRKISQRLSRC